MSTCRWAGALFLLTVAAVFATSGVGAFHVPYKTILGLWFPPLGDTPAQGADDTVRYIVIHVRLARACLALAVGSALAMAGAVYQGVLLNPLADPFTLGISTGAAFGASLAILLGAGGIHFLGVSALPMAAFAGALIALYLVYLLGRMDGRIHTTTIVLAGIIVSTFLSAPDQPFEEPERGFRFDHRLLDHGEPFGEELAPCGTGDSVPRRRRGDDPFVYEGTRPPQPGGYPGRTTGGGCSAGTVPPAPGGLAGDRRGGRRERCDRVRGDWWCRTWCGWPSGRNTDGCSL